MTLFGALGSTVSEETHVLLHMSMFPFLQKYVKQEFKQDEKPNLIAIGEISVFLCIPL